MRLTRVKWLSFPITLTIVRVVMSIVASVLTLMLAWLVAWMAVWTLMLVLAMLRLIAYLRMLTMRVNGSSLGACPVVRTLVTCVMVSMLFPGILFECSRDIMLGDIIMDVVVAVVCIAGVPLAILITWVRLEVLRRANGRLAMGVLRLRVGCWCRFVRRFWVWMLGCWFW